MKDCLLILNAAEARVQFVLARAIEGFSRGAESPVELLCAQEWSAPSRGTEILPAALEQAFQMMGLVPEMSLGRIACVCGPGSFTGIRLALTLGAALNRATGAPLCGINYLQALAATVPWKDGPSHTGRFVRVLTHARRNLVHVQDFWQEPVTDDWPEPLNEPRMEDLDHILAGVDVWCMKAPVILTGSGVTRNADVLLPLLPEGCRVAPERVYRPDNWALLQAALRATVQQNDLEPLYLRPCDAVDNLAHIAESRGQNPQEAEARLDALLGAQPDAAMF